MPKFVWKFVHTFLSEIVQTMNATGKKNLKFSIFYLCKSLFSIGFWCSFGQTHRQRRNYIMCIRKDCGTSLRNLPNANKMIYMKKSPHFPLFIGCIFYALFAFICICICNMHIHFENEALFVQIYLINENEKWISDQKKQLFIIISKWYQRKFCGRNCIQTHLLESNIVSQEFV